MWLSKKIWLKSKRRFKYFRQLRPWFKKQRYHTLNQVDSHWNDAKPDRRIPPTARKFDCMYVYGHKRPSSLLVMCTLEEARAGIMAGLISGRPFRVPVLCHYSSTQFRTEQKQNGLRHTQKKNAAFSHSTVRDSDYAVHVLRDRRKLCDYVRSATKLSHKSRLFRCACGRNLFEKQLPKGIAAETCMSVFPWTVAAWVSGHVCVWVSLMHNGKPIFPSASAFVKNYTKPFNNLAVSSKRML